jgi:tRNA(His) 5'-end guanylyltransferase
MKFDDLDAKMRIFETAHDYCVLPGIHIVVRLDGRNFSWFPSSRLGTRLSEAPASRARNFRKAGASTSA